MNVVVSNKFEKVIDSLELDVIKKVTGEYEVEEIIKMFSNLFFQRMILDITAIKNYRSVKNIQKLSISLDISKVIILLDDTPESNSPLYLSKLIAMGIYNFTKNKEGIQYLLEHPNTYRDVAHIQQFDNLTVMPVMPEVKTSTTPAGRHFKIIGVRNITEHAGATTLIYMLKKHLSKKYKVGAIEIEKRDFMFFNEKDMISVTPEQFLRELRILTDAYEIILVDLNTTNFDEACNEVLYLLEPSMLKVNRLIKRNPDIFKQYKDKKIILNRSLLSGKDIQDFEAEGDTKFFYNLPPLNDRIENQEIEGFLNKLGV